jgi:hypothetical protein
MASFVAFCSSLNLAVPDSRFYLTGLHDSLSESKAMSHRHELLSHGAVREVRHWSSIRDGAPFRPIWPRPITVSWALHTDSSLQA